MSHDIRHYLKIMTQAMQPPTPAVAALEAADDDRRDRLGLPSAPPWRGPHSEEDILRSRVHFSRNRIELMSESISDRLIELGKKADNSDLQGVLALRQQITDELALLDEYVAVWQAGGKI